MHIRQAIRENIKTVLTGLTDTGDRVYVNRVYPLSQSNSNGILIYTEDEQISYLAMGSNRPQERQVSFKVEIYVKQKTAYDDKIDDISVEVEQALIADHTRGGYAVDTTINNFTVDFNGDGDVTVAVGILDVMVKYHTREDSITTGA